MSPLARRVLPVATSAVLLVLWVACGSGHTGAEGALPEGRSIMELVSQAFGPGEPIPERFTCDGDDVSPPLGWEGVPGGTRSFALIMDDPDAPPGTWIHWVIYDLPGELRGLEQGVPKAERLENGAKQGACWGVDSFSRVGYYGPCPPPGKPHRYVFRLYALDSALDLPPGSSKAELLRAIEGHVLAEAELIGRYGR